MDGWPQGVLLNQLLIITLHHQFLAPYSLSGFTGWIVDGIKVKEKLKGFGPFQDLL